MELNQQQHLFIVKMLNELVETLEREEQGKADAPMFRVGGEGNDYSPRRILHEVAQQTRFGNDFAESWVELAMDHILHTKLTGSAQAMASAAPALTSSTSQ